MSVRVRARAKHQRVKNMMKRQSTRPQNEVAWLGLGLGIGLGLA